MCCLSLSRLSSPSCVSKFQLLHQTTNVNFALCAPRVRLINCAGSGAKFIFRRVSNAREIRSSYVDGKSSRARENSESHARVCVHALQNFRMAGRSSPGRLLVVWRTDSLTAKPFAIIWSASHGEFISRRALSVILYVYVCIKKGDEKRDTNFEML